MSLKTRILSSYLFVHTFCLHASETEIINWDGYPQTPDIQIERTDWRLQKENLLIWNKSWQCMLERDYECAIKQLRTFLAHELEDYQIIQVHNALAQNYSSIVMRAIAKKDRVKIDAVQEDIRKLNRDATAVKVLHHHLVVSFLRMRDWKSCAEYGSVVLESQEMRDFMLKIEMPLMVAQCFLALNEHEAAQQMVGSFLKATDRNREWLSSKYRNSFDELEL